MHSVINNTLCNDDAFEKYRAGVALRGEAWPGAVFCFYLGTLVSLHCEKEGCG